MALFGCRGERHGRNRHNDLGARIDRAQAQNELAQVVDDLVDPEIHELVAFRREHAAVDPRANREHGPIRARAMLRSGRE